MKNLINRALAAEKKLLFCATLVAAMMLTACGGNSNNSSKSDDGELLVGNWKYNFAGEDGFVVLTFYADGTGKSVEYDRGIIDSNFDFTYYYNDQKKQYIWCMEEGGYRYEETILYVTKTEMLKEGGKGPELYYRME